MTTMHPLRAWIAIPLAAALLTLPPPAVRAAPPATGVASELDLNAAQKARMQAGRDRFRKAMLALQADRKMTAAQKQAKAITLAAAADKDTLAILTPAQRDLVLRQRAIEDQFRQDVQALRADPKLTDPQKQARFETMMRDRQTALLATLPPSQRARIEQAHQAQMARAAEANRIGGQLQKSLSKQAMAQIQKITLETRAKMQAVEGDAGLSTAAKAAKIQTLGREAELKIDTFLTPPQRAQFARYHELVNPMAPQ